jgi:hypothetical protein
LATILQAYTGVSDDEAMEAMVMDRRWQLVLDCSGSDEPPFRKWSLVNSFAGKSVRVRFRIGSDSLFGDYGWFIDDVRLYTCT